VKAEIFKHLDAIEGQEQFLAKAMWDRMTRDATRGRLRFGERLDVVDIQRAPHLLEMRLQIASGLDVKVVQRCVRHASAKTTLDTYGHMFPDKEESARAAVSEVLKDRALQMRSAVIED
jgi:integrase